MPGISCSEIVLLAPIGMFQTDRGGLCVDVNARWCVMTGLSREEALGHGWARTVHPDDRDRVLAEWDAAVAEGRELVIEYRLQSSTASTWVLAHAVAIRDESQRVVGYVGTATDITTQKLADETAARAARTLRALLDQLPDVVVVHRFGAIVFANAAAEKALGYSADELRRHTVYDLVPPEELEPVRNRMKLLAEAHSPGMNPPRITRAIRKDRGVSLFEATSWRTDYEGEPAAVWLLHDLTARNARESQLRASLQGFTDAFFILEGERDLAGEVADFRIVELNRSLARMFDEREDVLWHAQLSRVVDAETFERLFGTYVRALELAEPVSEELELERFGIWVQHQVLPLPNGVVAIFRDTTEKRKAEERLRESEERWQFALEGTNQGVWDWTVDTGHVFFTKRWKAMLGFEEDEIPPHVEEWSSRVHPDDLPEVMRQIEQHFRGETPYYEAEHRVRCKDGSYLWILDRGRVISWTPDHRPRRMVGTHTDIRRRKEAERLLRRSLEEKEVLLKEVHHRVKNNLQVTSSLLNLQASRMSDRAAQVALGEARGRIHSIALLHDRLYQADDLSHVDLSEYTALLAGELRRTLGPERIALAIDAAPISVDLDVAMPYALVLNELVTNAFKHAFPGRAGTVEVQLHRDDDWAELVVRDDGIGLPAGFDLETSRSLGVTLVRMLANQLRGTLSMRSERGTVVTLRFPCPRSTTYATAPEPASGGVARPPD